MQNAVNPVELYIQMQPRMLSKIERSKVKVNLLPAIDVDFSEHFQTLLPKDAERPESTSRVDMNNHWANLQFQYRGQPEVLAINVLLVSYLRRDTKFTDHAWALFERLWSEHTEALLGIISMRDLVSSLRTFADHSQDPTRRLTAKLAFTYSHMIKIYESERAVEGKSLNEANYQFPAGCPSIGLKKSHGICVGGDNSFEIVNMLLAEEIQSDEVIGPMILTVLARVFEGDTVFSRYDAARIKAGFNVDSEREWAFGVKPLQS